MTEAGAASSAGVDAYILEKSSFRKSVKIALYDFALMIDMAEEGLL